MRENNVTILDAARRALIGATAAAAMTLALTGCSGATGASKAEKAPQTGFDIGYAAYASKQYEQAIDIWKRYAVAGDVRSQYILGEVYSNHPFADRDDVQQKPEVVKVDLVEALKWYTLAANYDFDTRIRYEHVDVTADERNASILANQRLPQVRRLMSDSDVDKAETLVSETFQRGSPYDLYRLGEMYQEGSGVEKDNVKALEMFILAQQRGVSQASAASAEIAKYMTKRDIDAAHDLATNWQPPLPVELTKPTPQQEENERLKKELEEIKLEDALKAVSDIDVELLQRSLRALGFYYGPIDNVMGAGTRQAIRRFQYSRVERDTQMTDQEKEAVKTGVLSARQTVDLIAAAASPPANDAMSQYVYGIMYTQGIGVETDGQQAVQWLSKAAEQDLAIANYALGVIYRDGTTGLNQVTPNKALAAQYFARAYALGYKKAGEALRLLDFRAPKSGN